MCNLCETAKIPPAVADDPPAVVFASTAYDDEYYSDSDSSNSSYGWKQFAVPLILVVEETRRAAGLLGHAEMFTTSAWLSQHRSRV